MGYRVYFFGGRAVVAAPNSSRRLRRAALRHYPAETRRRWLFKQGLRAAAALGLDGLISKRVDALPFPQEFDLIAWIEEVGQQLKRTDLQVSVVWPPPARSTARVYMHLLAPDGARIAFAKVSFDADNDARLGNEAHALAKLHSARHDGFAVPKVLAWSQHHEHRYLVTESLPLDVRPLPCSWDFIKRAVVDRYSGAVRVLDSSNVERLDWWSRFLALTDSQCAFAQELLRRGLDGIEVCHVHGDLAPQNLAFGGGATWLFDWEESNENGPRLTDEVRFYLAVHQSRMLGNPARGALEFANHFHLSAEPKRRAVMMAIVFLHSAGIRAATKVVEHWLPTEH